MTVDLPTGTGDTHLFPCRQHYNVDCACATTWTIHRSPRLAEGLVKLLAYGSTFRYWLY